MNIFTIWRAYFFGRGKHVRGRSERCWVELDDMLSMFLYAIICSLREIRGRISRNLPTRKTGLLRLRVRRNVPETNTSQASHHEIQRRCDCAYKNYQQNNLRRP